MTTVERVLLKLKTGEVLELDTLSREDAEQLLAAPTFVIGCDHNRPADGYAGSVHCEVCRNGRRRWYRLWRDRLSGRLRKQYIRKGDAARVVQGVEARKRFERECRLMQKIWEEARAELGMS